MPTKVQKSKIVRGTRVGRYPDFPIPGVLNIRKCGLDIQAKSPLDIMSTTPDTQPEANGTHYYPCFYARADKLMHYRCIFKCFEDIKDAKVHVQRAHLKLFACPERDCTHRAGTEADLRKHTKHTYQDPSTKAAKNQAPLPNPPLPPLEEAKNLNSFLMSNTEEANDWNQIFIRINPHWRGDIPSNLYDHNTAYEDCFPHCQSRQEYEQPPNPHHLLQAHGAYDPNAFPPFGYGFDNTGFAMNYS